MNKIWLVFKYEYLRHVLRKRFLLGLLSVPLIIAFSIGVGFLSVLVTVDTRPVGYVDEGRDHSGGAAGVFEDPQGLSG